MGYWKERKMAGKGKGANKPWENRDFTPKTFVNVVVEAEKREGAKQYFVDGAWADWLDERLEAAYKLTIKYDVAHSCFTALMFCENQDDPNCDFILSARASTVTGAIILLCWGDQVWSQGAWQSVKQDQLDLFA